MEPTKDKIYFLIESLRRCNKNASEIHDMIQESWPDYNLSAAHIRRICMQFRNGERLSFDRKPGSGTPISANRKENIQRVRQLIEEDYSLSLRDIADAVGISHTMVQRILSEDLEMLWMHTTWVPHTLSDRNKAIRIERCRDMLDALTSRLTIKNLVTIDEKFFYCRKVSCARNKIGCWIGPFGDETPIQTGRRTPMDKKFLVIVAISQQGHHYFEILPRNQSIDANRYIQFLVNLETFLRNLRNPILPENLRLIHDNATPHTAALTTQHIESRNIRLLRQAAYSPDTNLCDRYLFPRLEALTTDFDSQEDTSHFLTEQLPNFTAQRMNKALQDCMAHMRKIIENGGNYC